jgi:hypothetical protein
MTTDLSPLTIQRQQAHLRRCRKDVAFRLGRLGLNADEKAALLGELCRINRLLRKLERERLELIELRAEQGRAVEWVCEWLDVGVRE